MLAKAGDKRQTSLGGTKKKHESLENATRYGMGVKKGTGQLLGVHAMVDGRRCDMYGTDLNACF